VCVCVCEKAVDCNIIKIPVCYPIMSNYFTFTGSNISGECGVDEFQCHDKSCISLAKRCDRHPYDCPDGSDEENCGGEIHYHHLKFMFLFMHQNSELLLCNIVS
jgi:hypothetical protein